MDSGAHHPEAIIFVGIQASGKSTFYQKRFADTHVRINLDTLKTRANEQLALHDCISKRKSFVVDNTNPLPRDRARYLVPAKAAGFRLVAYVFDSSLKEAISRNKAREGKGRIPIPAIAMTLRKLQRPSKAEGFDQVFEVKIAASADETRFLVNPCPH
jgi:predicted kinase